MDRQEQSRRLKKKNWALKRKLLDSDENNKCDNDMDMEIKENPTNTDKTSADVEKIFPASSHNDDLPLEKVPSDPETSHELQSLESLHGSASTLSFAQSHVDSDHSDDSEAAYTSDDDEASNVPRPMDIVNDIKIWGKKHPMPSSIMDSLLKVLHRYHPTLPLSSKTLFKEPQNRKYEITKLNSFHKEIQAEIVYFGISEHLQKTVNPAIHVEKKLPMKFNVDGVSLYNSSSVEFWVISGQVHTTKDYYEPFPITVHCGAGKPADLDIFLDKFMTELNLLLKNGIIVGETEFTVEIMCFTCDRQARVYIKCTKGHGGYYACEVCMVRGKLVNKTVYYPVSSEDPLRTDASFRSKENPEHHTGDSPLLKIDPEYFDIIDDIMMDLMHQGCLGNMKKISTEYWFKSQKKILTRQQMLSVSQRLMNISSQIPSEFQRTTRSLAEMSNWEATEWRLFLLYVAPFIMRGILPLKFWQNFMLLNNGCVILNSESLHELYIDVAEQYLKLFCETAPDPELYGPEISVINLHNTSHLARDVRNKKCTASALSAFLFENLYGKMKRAIRSGNKPLQQLCNRLNDCLEGKRPEIEPDFKILKMKRHKDGSIIIHKIKFHRCELTTTKPNNVVLLKSGEVMRIKSMQSSKKTNKMEDVIVKGNKIKIVGPGYDYPTDSSLFNIFQVIEEGNSEKIEEKLTNVECKMFFLSNYEFPEDGQIDSYVMPLLHMN